MGLVRMLWLFIRGMLSDQTELAVENLALRQQLAALEYRSKRLRLRKRDRIFWGLLSRVWSNWRSALLIVQPETVVHWHRQGFKLFWRWKSRGRKPGRPNIESEIRRLIRRMSCENPGWGAPRIHSELLLLGYIVCETTVANYMKRNRKPPTQTLSLPKTPYALSTKHLRFDGLIGSAIVFGQR